MKQLAARMRAQTTLSFEFFPPKTAPGMEKLADTLERLGSFQPAYMSCTYGAGGGNVGRNREVLQLIQQQAPNTVPLTHFTCVCQTKQDIANKLAAYLDMGVDHVLALRGDFPVGYTGAPGELRYAADLVRFIRREFGDRFEIAVSGSPEGHIACESFEADIAHLRQKQDAGADYIVTQLTYDMPQFERWLAAIRRAGITLPVDVGVMPVLKKDAVLTQCLSRNGCAIPRELAEIFSHHWFDRDGEGHVLPEVQEAFRAEGTAYTVRQIHRYLALGVNGIHLYAMNNWKDVSEIVTRAGLAPL